jgi:hypothetical protein
MHIKVWMSLAVFMGSAIAMPIAVLKRDADIGKNPVGIMTIQQTAGRMKMGFTKN